MILKIFIGLVLLILAFVALVLFQPATYHYSHQRFIAAPPTAVFAQVNDLHRYPAWQPWVKAEADPAIKRSYSGPSAGVGAVYSWEGNAAVGTGRMTIIESKPHELIRVRDDYAKPFPAISDMEFQFKPEKGGTEVTWIMTGRSDTFILKAVHLLMRKVLDGQFEQGLTDLKAVSEAAAK